MAAATLHWADYIIFVGFFGLSLAIGIYYAVSGGRQRTTSEFIMADRKLSVLPTMLSLMMSYLSAIMVLGIVAIIYFQGTAMPCWLVLGFLTAVFFVERVLVPWLHPLHLTSAFEYFEKRFKGKAVRILCSTIGILNMILYIGSAIFAPSIALEAVSGIPVKASIPIMSLVATAYTSLGGMKAVIWTDVFQSVVMLAGVVGVFIKATMLAGGLTQVMDMAREAQRFMPASRSADPTVPDTVWALWIGFAFTWSFMYGVSQAAVQRYSATRTLRDARLTMISMIPVMMTLVILLILTGVAIFAYFYNIRCDPLRSGAISSPNQIFPYFVAVGFTDAKGFQGLVLATLYSGALSSVSSSLSGCAANIWEDLLKIKLGKKLTEHQAAIFNKGLVIFVGLLGMAIAYLCDAMPGNLVEIVMMFLGATGGPLLGIFIVSGISRRTNWIGTMVGGLTSLAFCLWLGIGAMDIKVRGRYLPPVPIDGCPGDNSTLVETGPLITESIYKTTQHIVSTTQHLLSTEQATLAPTASTSSGLDKLYSIHYLWYTPLGVLVCVVVGLIVSLIAGKVCPDPSMDDVEEELLIHWSKILTLAPFVAEKEEDKKKEIDKAQENGVMDKDKEIELTYKLLEDLKESDV